MTTPSQLADLILRSAPQGEIDERDDAASFATALGDVLADNFRMLQLCRELGFVAGEHPDDQRLVRVRLPL